MTALRAKNSADLSPQEAGRIGDDIYERELKAKLEPAHNGEVVVINLTNGDYFVGPDDHEVMEQAQAKYPGELFYATRVGEGALYVLHTPYSLRK